MKFQRGLAGLLAAVVLLAPRYALAGDDDGILAQAASSTQGTGVGAEAAIVMEAVTGRVLFEQNIHEQLPIASTTKIMTALIALEQNNVDAVFEVDPEAIQVEGSSMGLQKGDQASLRSLAVGMLLASGNDGANAAAVRIAGSQAAFAQLMNERAAEIGMVDTSFETPSGLDGESHYSTAYDMALLARTALQNEAFREICSQYKMRTAYGNPPYDRWLTNHNKLLNYYEGTIGVKTGFTKKAGRCLVSAVEKDGITLICVTLDCPGDWDVHQGLYNRYFGEMELLDVTGSIPGLELPVTGGTALSVAAAPYEQFSVPVQAEGSHVEYRFRAEQFLYAPVLRGQYVGEVDVLLNGEHLRTFTLAAGGDVPLLHEYVEEKGFWDFIQGLFT